MCLQFEQASTPATLVVLQDAFIVVHEELTFNLVNRLQGNTYNDYHRCATKGKGIYLEDCGHDVWNDGNDCQGNGATECQSVHNSLDVILCWLARANAKDKATVLFHVICNLIWLENNFNIEETEKDNEKNEKDKINWFVWS